ncbi:MAG: UDP-3-O-(3-hydroxymyristoyl)glucosamine N-acyltransferase [Acidobacteria bacterium]|nr:MAG: UDP-3-O-(3-hydroxymyristoyl)glucosamine N-acyltransferase [Acidobacteriota bacterium]
MKVSEIARLVGGEANGEKEKNITGVAALDSATEQDLAFADGGPALRQAADSRAGCILVPEGTSVAGRTTIAVRNLRLAFIRAAEALQPPPKAPHGIHPTALIAADAHLGLEVSVGPYCVIESGARVGAGSRLGAGVYVGEGVALGARCILHPRVSIYPGVQVGDRVVLHAGVVLGSEGFGYLFAEGRQQKFPQLGGLVIENDVEIGANTTVDRGSLGTTRIGEGTKIDNLVQVAHNVRIGRHAVIAAQTGISGSAEIGDFVTLAGQVGVADHVRIEDGAVIGAQAGIPTGKAVRKGSVMWGTPARPLSEFKKMYAHLSRLPALAQKVKELSGGPPAKKK